MTSTLTDPQLALADLDFDPELRCAFPDGRCESHHEQPATLRLLVEHGESVDDHAHDRVVVIACDACYEWLIRNPSKIVVCPEHGPIARVRDWWSLLGTV